MSQSKDFDFELFSRQDFDPIESKNNSNTIRNEIKQLNELLELLSTNNVDKQKVEKIIPYNSEALRDTIKELLSSNLSLKDKIIS